jgi:hypothetical protein
MNSSFQTWTGQVTTGHGVMILAPTLLGIVGGSISWATAFPLLTAGLIGLLWPENTAAANAGKAFATDVEALIAAYRTGMTHALADQTATGSVPTVPARTNVAATGLATLAITAAALGACGNQTPAQQQSTITAVASGLVCVADTTGKVVAAASTSDPDSLKAANAVVAAGGALTTDAACQSAITNGTVAIATTVPQPVPAVTKP